jgi:uncharacterized protein YqeY
MLERNDKKKEFLRVVVGEMGRKESKVLDDKAVIGLLKGMRESALLLKNDFEVEIIDSYVPKTLSEDETREIVKGIVESAGIATMKEIGRVMGAVKSHEKASQIDNSLVSKILKEILS